MKKTKVCPKCAGTEILRAEGDIGGYDTRNFILPGKTWFSAVPVHRYICCDCGYAEEWIDSRDLMQLKAARSKKKNP